MRRVDPLVAFLIGEEGPAIASGLFWLAGHTMPPRHRRDTEDWLRALHLHPQVARWALSERAFVPPAAWPEELAQHEHYGIDPLYFARDVLPTYQNARRYGILYKELYGPGLWTLSAVAHGWPWGQLARWQQRAAADAMAALHATVPYTLWALNVDLRGVPLGPDRGQGRQVGSDYTCRMKGRLRALEDPLAMTDVTLKQALPRPWRSATILQGLPTLPPRLKCGSRTPLIATEHAEPRFQVDTKGRPRLV